MGTTTLDRVCAKTDHPKTIRVDQDSELICRDRDLRACANEVTLDLSRSRKLTDDGLMEAFDRKLRSECPNVDWFLTLADARK
ncbi:hypothetical protein JAN5088_03455 [Jannaschia rubra]|uniref:Uncharacterized protein n=1 Tax=Jannaschia rubra TaxID=282197 RepID=A0A0M6XU46_9RHOB|nr:hypothetical protein JAN5088_03455 [Jannaschia rubra]SFG64014.1 putative transposase [Jannaschia rubra]